MKLEKVDCLMEKQFRRKAEDLPSNSESWLDIATASVANSRKVTTNFKRPTTRFKSTYTTAIMSSTTQSVQCFGKKKTATAVAHCKAGKGLIKVNGRPLSLVEPQILRFKVYEPVLILGLDKFGASQNWNLRPKAEERSWI